MKSTTPRLALAALGAAAVLTLGIVPLRATPSSGTPAAKVTAAVSQTQLLTATAVAGWDTILSNTIKTPNQKDLFIDVSLESGLVTRTAAQSHGGHKDTSVASAEVRVRVLIDGHVAYPGEVIFAGRTQELSATLDGLISSCFIVDENGNVVLDEDCVEPEEIELILSTMSANAFNFVYPDCGTGVHTFEVQARVETSTDVQEGEAEAFAMIGRGSCTVEEVRMVNDEDIELE
jgi:hypothetical protein